MVEKAGDDANKVTADVQVCWNVKCLVIVWLVFAGFQELVSNVPDNEKSINQTCEN